MRYLLIDPTAQTVEMKDHPGKVDWRVITEAIGCDLMTCAGRFPNGDILWVDDEGLLKDSFDSFLIRELNLQVLAGRGVVTGPESPEDFETGEGGEITDCQTAPDAVLAMVIWSGTKAVEKITYAEDRSVEGVTVITSTLHFR